MSEQSEDPGAPAGEGAGRDGERTYEGAVARLDEIIARLDSGKAELRETLGLVREGKALVEYCKGELDAVSGELEKLDLAALVDQLEAAGGE
ncbi:MAG TPA: exodeoxyribonuclease VII small subunit [Solirubrobacterales bacterium]|nr:exodeoxyribonuclease VII small subunit [Solirubrobacterales bacterium]